MEERPLNIAMREVSQRHLSNKFFFEKSILKKEIPKQISYFSRRNHRILQFFHLLDWYWLKRFSLRGGRNRT